VIACGCGSWGGFSIKFGAREVEDDGLGLGVQFFFLQHNAVGMQELVGDVGKDRGATGRDAAFGHQDEETGKEFAEVFGGGELGMTGEEVFREVGGIIGEGREDGRDLLAEMLGTKAKLRFRSSQAATGAILIAMLAARAGWRRAGACGGGRWSFRG